MCDVGQQNADPRQSAPLYAARSGLGSRSWRLRRQASSLTRSSQQVAPGRQDPGSSETPSLALPPAAPPPPAQLKAVVPCPGRNPRKSGLQALQDSVFARDLGHFEHLVLPTEPALWTGSLLHSFKPQTTRPSSDRCAPWCA